MTSIATFPLIVDVRPVNKYLFNPNTIDGLKQLGPWTMQDRLYLPGKVEIELADVVWDGEDAVLGGAVMGRAEKLSGAGQLHAEKLARGAVPKKWDGLNVLFPGTRWINRNGRVWIPALKCSGTLGRRFFHQAGVTCGETFRIACAREMSAN